MAKSSAAAAPMPVLCRRRGPTAEQGPMSEARRAPPRTVRARVTVGGARACAARSPGQDQSRRQAGGKDEGPAPHLCVLATGMSVCARAHNWPQRHFSRVLHPKTLLHTHTLAYSHMRIANTHIHTHVHTHTQSLAHSASSHTSTNLSANEHLNLLQCGPLNQST